MLHQAPEFKYYELPQLDELGLELPKPVQDTRLLTELALKNIALIQEVLGPAIFTERAIPTGSMLRLESIRLARSEDRFAVTVLRQHVRLRRPVGADVWHYLYYANPTLAHLAQVDIAKPSPVTSRPRLLGGIATMSFQRFMTPIDHANAEEFIRVVRG